MAKPTFAAIPGTGPAGETCFTCIHTVMVGQSKLYSVCGKVAEMTQTRRENCGQVYSRDRACRYWARRSDL